MKRAGLTIALCAVLAAAAFAQQPPSSMPWLSTDPGELKTEIPFTIEWAKRLHGFQTLADLQRAAGSRGKLHEYVLFAQNPHAVYRWESNTVPMGVVIARVFTNGFIGVAVFPSIFKKTGHLKIAVNNYGTFLCYGCEPDIEILGDDWKPGPRPRLGH